ncbi:MAG: hypothetical protein LUD72_12390 [Bacteroidales bacterium]|nr:hypothetical protein [Bacteroidales bacterium]
MTCNNCHANFKRALELESRDLVCPSCFKSLIPGEKDYAVTTESDDCLKLSETYYLSYLEIASNRDPEAAGNRSRQAKKNEYIRMAIEYCGMAAERSHPEALVDMGYYCYKHPDRMNFGTDPYANYRAAYRYFASVIKKVNGNGILRAYRESETYHARAKEKTDEVVKKALFYLKDMYLSAPFGFVADRAGNMYGAMLVTERVEKELEGRDIDFSFDITGETASSAGGSKVETLKEIFAECKQKVIDRPPIFGIFGISQSDYDLLDPVLNGKDWGIQYFLVRQGKSGDMEKIDFRKYSSYETFDGADRVFFCFLNIDFSCRDFKKEIGNPGKSIGEEKIKTMFKDRSDDLKIIVKNICDNQYTEDYVFLLDDVYFVNSFVRDDEKNKISKDSIGVRYSKYLEDMHKS